MKSAVTTKPISALRNVPNCPLKFTLCSNPKVISCAKRACKLGLIFHSVSEIQKCLILKFETFCGHFQTNSWKLVAHLLPHWYRILMAFLAYFRPFYRLLPAYFKARLYTGCPGKFWLWVLTIFQSSQKLGKVVSHSLKSPDF